MKIDAYNEQQRITELFEKKDNRPSGVKETVSGQALAEAAFFDRNGQDSGLFAVTNYGTDEAGKGRAASIEEVADEAALFKANMKAICNKMDMGELVTIDEEGVDINDVKADRIVTVGEQIRIKLAAAGNEYVYTGDLDAADIEAVYGSGMAYMVADKLAQYNYPVTEENIEEVTSALMEAAELTEPDLGAKAYLMNNNLEPTVENLYKAEHAGNPLHAGNALHTGNPLSSKNSLTEAEWQKLLPQIEGMLTENGMDSDGDTMKDIRELIEGGVSITPESLANYRAVLEAGEIIVGIHAEDPEAAGAYMEALADKIAAAMVDLKAAKETDLSDEPVDWQKAREAVRVLDGVTSEALTEFIAGAGSGKYGMTLEGLGRAEEEAQAGQEERPNPLDTYAVPEKIENVREVRLLFEARLMMTFEAAYILEKNGIEVNTAELSNLVEELRRIETAESYMPKQNARENDMSLRTGDFDTFADKLKETIQSLGGLKTAPCDVIGRAGEWSRVTLEDMEKTAFSVQREYEAAGRAYETMATEIRSDLGDRIDKAVAASADSVLKELDFETSKENERAVRILAYNDMEITAERLMRVKEIDAAVNNLFNKMTPDIALDMLRDGTDIMGMGLEELSEEVDRRKEEKETVVTQKFSEYLYNLDRKGKISAEDREKYMALYTIVNKLVKDKGKAAGQLVNQNREATVGNLVSAYMTRNDAGIDMNTAQEGQTQSGRPEHNNAKLSYYKELLSQLSETPKEAAALVTDNELPCTMNNLAAAGSLYENGGYVYKGMKKAGVEASLDRFLQAMDSKEALLNAYQELGGQLKEAVELAMEQGGTADFRALQNLGNGMALLGAMSRHNTFYIPYDSDAKTGAIRLSVVENSDMAGSFTVEMQSEKYGHVYISAKVEGDALTAYVLFGEDSPQDGAGFGEGTQAGAFSELWDRVGGELKKQGFSSVKLSGSTAKELPPVKGGTSGKTEVRKLFAAAKVFVENFR